VASYQEQRIAGKHCGTCAYWWRCEGAGSDHPERGQAAPACGAHQHRKEGSE
jgi:hypothetical protein